MSEEEEMKVIRVQVANFPSSQVISFLTEAECLEGLVCRHPDDEPKDDPAGLVPWPVREHRKDHVGCMLVGVAVPEGVTI